MHPDAPVATRGSASKRTDKRIVSPRFTVGSSKLRGEPRVFYVVDNDASQFSYPNSRYASPPFTRREAAEKECARLNARANKTASLTVLHNKQTKGL